MKLSAKKDKISAQNPPFSKRAVKFFTSVPFFAFLAANAVIALFSLIGYNMFGTDLSMPSWWQLLLSFLYICALFFMGIYTGSMKKRGIFRAILITQFYPLIFLFGYVFIAAQALSFTSAIPETLISAGNFFYYAMVAAAMPVTPFMMGITSIITDFFKFSPSAETAAFLGFMTYWLPLALFLLAYIIPQVRDITRAVSHFFKRLSERMKKHKEEKLKISSKKSGK